MSRAKHDVALICENGHLVNAYYHTEQSANAEFCAKCGAATSPKCQKCEGETRGDWLGSGGHFSVPDYCRHCGEPHIWTQKVIQAGEHLFAKLEGLSTEDRERLNKSIPDLIFETERTPEAALSIKQALAEIETGSRSFLVEWLKHNAVGMVNRLLGLDGPTAG